MFRFALSESAPTCMTEGGGGGGGGGMFAGFDMAGSEA